MELHARRIVHAAVTRSPTDEWAAQQLREATPWGEGPKYLIRDRDAKYGRRFAAVAGGIQILKTPVRAPRANSFCERLIGSLRRECLDLMLVINRRQLDRSVQEYLTITTTPGLIKASGSRSRDASPMIIPVQQGYLGEGSPLLQS